MGVIVNRIACLLNSPELGGAERSFITQISLLENTSKIDLFYPTIGDLKASSQLEELVKKKTGLKLKTFSYEEGLYRKSRSSKTGFVLSLISLLFQSFRFKFEGFYKYNTIWCNGNKVFYPIVIGALLFGYKGTLLWHLRDYPAKGAFNTLINWLVDKFSCFELSLIGNSTSVVEEYKKVFKKLKIHRVYNPVEDVPNAIEKESTGVIGFAGMSAPWKGLHELYLFASLYEEELIKLGIKEIAIFGKNIYHTEGDHQSYESEIEKLALRFPSKLIVKKGLVRPFEIFNSIDVMLHLSVKKEPFGRVLLESFSYGVPCISTGLGGAGELMKNFPELIHYSFDYGGLLLKIGRLFNDPKIIVEHRSRGREEYKSFQSLAKSDLKTLEQAYFQ